MIERSFHTPRALALELSIPRGSIDVESVDGDETTVVLEGDERELAEARVELVERAGMDVLIVEHRRRFGIEISIGSIGIGRGSLTLRVRCPHGAAATLKTVSAESSVRGSVSSLELNTVSGDATIDAQVEGDAAIKSVSGDVRLAQVAGSLRANLVSGDLQTGDVDGPVDVRTVSGDARVASVREGESRINSVSGDIELGIRSGSRLDVDASSVSGDLRSELELSDLPASGEGPVVVLRGKTISGDLRVVRA
jgi:hypothetical protein